MRLCTTLNGLDEVEETGHAASSATADAGDEVGNEEAEAQGDEEARLGVSTEDGLTAGHRVSKLLARAVAAKEVTAKQVVGRPRASNRNLAQTAEEADEDDGGEDV